MWSFQVSEMVCNNVRNVTTSRLIKSQIKGHDFSVILSNTGWKQGKKCKPFFPPTALVNHTNAYRPVCCDMSFAATLRFAVDFWAEIPSNISLPWQKTFTIWSLNPSKKTEWFSFCLQLPCSSQAITLITAIEFLNQKQYNQSKGIFLFIQALVAINWIRYQKWMILVFSCGKYCHFNSHQTLRIYLFIYITVFSSAYIKLPLLYRQFTVMTDDGK